MMSHSCDVVLFQFHQIFPDRAPRAGTGEFAVGFFQEKFRMIFLQGRAPAGVVDDDVNEDARAERVRGVGEFAKLVNAGGALVEFDQRRIHGGQIERGIRAAKTAETRVSRRRRMHGQQVKDAAAECLDDVRQLARQVAEFAGRRDDGEVFPVERLDLRLDFFIARGRQIFRRAEQPREGAVNGVGGAGEIRVDGNSHVRAVRPVLPVFFVEQIGLGLEVADLGERQFDLPAVGGFLHRHVAPGGSGGSGTAGVGGDDFAAAGGGAAEVGAEQRAPAGAFGAGTEREADAVADEAQEAFAGGRRHVQIELRHIGPVRAAGRPYNFAVGGGNQCCKCGRTNAEGPFDCFRAGGLAFALSH